MGMYSLSQTGPPVSCRETPKVADSEQKIYSFNYIIISIFG
jgi:hypothetical protein